MKNKIRLICIGIFLNLSLSSQPLVLEKVFNFSSNDALIDFIPTEDQGFVMIGSSSNNSFVMKLDLNGDLLWKNIIGTSGDYFTQIIQTQNSDLLITGQQSGDAVLLRLSNSGDSISSIYYHYMIYENSFIGIIELENEDLIIAERREQDGGNQPPRVFLMGLSSEGSFKWLQDIGDEDYPYSIILTENSNIVVTGLDDWWDGTKIWISSYDSLGNQLNEIIMDGLSGHQIIESSNGYLYAAVYGISSNGNYKAVKLDSDCVLEWKLNNYYNGYDWYFNTICQLEPNRFAIGGSIQNILEIIIFNENGDSISSFTFNDYIKQHAKRMFSNQTSITVGANIKYSSNNNSILVFQLLIDSLYTSNNSSNLQSRKTNPFIFPNPAEKVINISDFQAIGEPTTVSIFSINGALKILKQLEPESQLNINIELLTSGFYMAKITTKDKTAYCKFVVKGQSR